MSMSAVSSYDTSFRAGGISRPLGLSTSFLVFLMLWQFLPTRGAEYASQVFGCIVCNTATTGYYLPKRCVLYSVWGSTDCGYSFQYSLSEMDPLLFHFLRMLIILFLCLCMGSLLSLVYVFVSPTMSVIFSLFLVVFIITAALPLSAESMMMELSFFSVCVAILSPLLMLDFGSLASLMVHTICPLCSSAAISVMYFATTSEPAMISSTK